MSRINRSDIHLAVNPTTGEMWAAQGNPAWETMPGGMEYETGLYYSQVRHRVAYLWTDGRWRIGTPTDAQNAVEVRPYHPLPRCTGRARQL
jgi:hypothetical protein